MGLLINGVWEQEDSFAGKDGKFERQASTFRNWVTADGAAGPTGEAGFAAESGRYHLYVSLACPWAHRTLILRELKGLSSMISVSVTHWRMGESGWSFDAGPGVVPDCVNHVQYVHQLYQKADPTCSTRASIPILWDTQRHTIVSNESADIIRMFNSAFDHLGAREGDFYPLPLRQSIDDINERIYDAVNNGVYKCGFATTQQAYEQALTPLFEMLDELESRLGSSRYLVGDRITEADWRLFTTLVRFDAVYAGHFKCNLRRIVDYPHLWAYLRALYQWPGVAATVDMDHIKRHYYESHRQINPTGIVPAGPVLDFGAPLARSRR